MDKDLAWSVAMTKPRQESYAQARLAEQDFATYLPMVAKRDKLGRQIGTMPMFPGYCFCGLVMATDQARSSSINFIHKLYQLSPETCSRLAVGEFMVRATL